MPKQKLKITKKDIFEEKKDNDVWWQDSKKAGKKTIAIIGILALVIIAIGFVSILSSQKNKLSQKETAALKAQMELSKKDTQNQLDILQSKILSLQEKLDSAEKTATTDEKATIEGSLSFPGSYIPENMEICAQDIKDEKNLVCTKDHITDKKYTYSIGYKIEVPAGSYNVYASVSTWQGYKSYYSDFVTCGLKATCPSHNPIEVKAEGGKTISSIDPIDWYKQ